MSNEYLNILVKVNKETGELDVVKQQLSGLDNVTKKSTNSMSELGGSFSLIKALLPTITWATLIYQLKQSVEMGEREAEVLRNLKFALDANNVGTKENVDMLIKQSKYIQEVSRVSDDEYLAAITKSVNMTGNLNTSMRIVNASMGISKNTSIEMSTAMMYLTQAANGQEFGLTRLARSGLAAYIDKSKSAHDNAEALIKKFETQYKDTETLTGKTKQLTGQIDDMKESLGKSLSPILAEQLGLLSKVVDGLLFTVLNVSNLSDKAALKISQNSANMNLVYAKEYEAGAKKLEALQAEGKYQDERNNTIHDNATTKQRVAQQIRIDKLREMAKEALLATKSEVDYQIKLTEQIYTNGANIDELVAKIKGLSGAKKAVNDEDLANGKILTEQWLMAQRQKNEQLLKLEQDYQIQIAALDQDASEQKKLINEREEQDRHRALYEIITGNKEVSDRKIAIWLKEAETNKKITKEQLAAIKKMLEVDEKEKVKTQKEIMAEKVANLGKIFEITKNFVEAGLTLAGEEFKKRKDWATAMIVLEKSIAIMGAISSAMSDKTTPFGLKWAMAGSMIALITAQAAKQITDIGKTDYRPSGNTGENSSNVSLNNGNPLQTEQHNFGGQAVNIGNGGFGQGSESGKNIINVHFSVIDPTSLTTDAQEKMARWLKNVLDNENKR